MNTKVASGILCAIASIGVTSAAFADSFVEQKTVTSSGCPTSVTRTTTTETTAAPIVEERVTTVERPVIMETPIVERKIIRSAAPDTIKVKEVTTW